MQAARYSLFAPTALIWVAGHCRSLPEQEANLEAPAAEP